MFDRVEIYVKAGDGGDGIISFRREKFVPFGGPDGGDGGNGGSVFIVGDRRMTTLSWFRQRRRFKAESGENGAGKKMHGKNGDDLTISVPLGTVVFKKNGKEKVMLADMAEEGQKVVVARCGRGGFGNTHFASPT